MTQPALGNECKIQGDGRDGRSNDEERLEAKGADVTDEGDLCVDGHGWEVRASLVDCPVDEHAEEHPQPDDAGE